VNDSLCSLSFSTPIPASASSNPVSVPVVRVPRRCILVARFDGLHVNNAISLLPGFTYRSHTFSPSRCYHNAFGSTRTFFIFEVSIILLPFFYLGFISSTFSSYDGLFFLRSMEGFVDSLSKGFKRLV